jgi:hypothetical protein
LVLLVEVLKEKEFEEREVWKKKNSEKEKRIIRQLDTSS